MNLNIKVLIYSSTDQFKYNLNDIGRMISSFGQQHYWSIDWAKIIISFEKSIYAIYALKITKYEKKYLHFIVVWFLENLRPTIKIIYN